MAFKFLLRCECKLEVLRRSTPYDFCRWNNFTEKQLWMVKHI